MMNDQHNNRDGSTVSKAVLVLNASYEPIQICTARRAIVLILKGAAASQEETPDVIRSPSITLQIPAVIRLLEYVRIPFRAPSLSKRHIFLRDHYRCQYCGKRATASDLTMDHILPISRGGKHIWENVVTACRSCNHRKGNQTPREAGMTLIAKPKPKPAFFDLQLVRYLGREHSAWRKYLYFD